MSYYNKNIIIEINLKKKTNQVTFFLLEMLPIIMSNYIVIIKLHIFLKMC